MEIHLFSFSVDYGMRTIIKIKKKYREIRYSFRTDIFMRDRPKSSSQQEEIHCKGGRGVKRPIHELLVFIQGGVCRKLNREFPFADDVKLLGRPLRILRNFTKCCSRCSEIDCQNCDSSFETLRYSVLSSARKKHSLNEKSP